MLKSKIAASLKNIEETWEYIKLIPNLSRLCSNGEMK